MSALIIAPTHKEGNEITELLRERLNEAGIVGKDETVLSTLTPLDWTEAERSDRAQYVGSDVVVQFHRSSGPFKAGQRVSADDLLKAKDYTPKGEHFSVYRPGEIALAVGDLIRATYNVKSKDGKHRMDNGTVQTVAGFTAGGDIRLSNGWVLDRKVGHIKFGYVTTSHAAQGKTCDRVFIAMGQESLPAIDAATFYVATSRGRTQARIYSGLSPAVMREAIMKLNRRKSATELLAGDRRTSSWRERARSFGRVMRERFQRWRARAQAVNWTTPRRPEVEYVR